MSGTQHEQDEDKIDEALEDTFPASDPPSTGGSTGPGHSTHQDKPKPGGPDKPAG